MNTTNRHTQTKTYILLEGDTMYSIADKFGLEANAIRNFHNEHASLNNHIPFSNDIPEHVLEILLSVAALQNIKSHTLEVPVVLKNQNSLHCDFSILNHNYGVVLYLETQKGKKRIHYTTALECTKEFEFVYDLILNKSQVYIDYKIPDMLADSLANSLAKPLYPIEVQVGRSGKLLRVTNQPEIYKQWKIEKPKLLRYFRSSIAERQIQAADIAYQNTTAIEKALRRDLFFTLYCSRLYTKYFSKLEIENTLRIPIYPFIRGIQYQVKQHIHPFLNANGNITLHQIGKVSDSRSSKDIEQSKDEPYYKGDPLEGELDITYEFCNQKHIIKSIRGTVTLLMNQQLDKKITIEAYQLT